MLFGFIPSGSFYVKAAEGNIDITNMNPRTFDLNLNSKEDIVNAVLQYCINIGQSPYAINDVYASWDISGAIVAFFAAPGKTTTADMDKLVIYETITNSTQLYIEGVGFFNSNGDPILFTQSALTMAATDSGTKGTYGEIYNLSTTGGSGSGAVSYSIISTNSIFSINNGVYGVITGNQLEVYSPGTFILQATKASDGTYDTAYSSTYTLTAPSSSTTIYGDVNGDGVVDTADITLLRRYVAGWPITINLAAADVNGDGVVDTADITLLRRYVAGWDITLGP